MEEKNHEEKLGELEPVEIKSMKCISDNVNLIIDEFDLYSLISIISTIFSDHKILIITDNQMIRKIFENFADTTIQIGFTTDSTAKRINIIHLS